MRSNAQILLTIAALGCLAACGDPASGAAGSGREARSVVLVYRPHDAGAAVPASALRRRLARLGVEGATVASAGDHRLSVTLPDRRTADRLKGTLGAVGLLRFYDWEANVLGRDGRPHPTDSAVTGGPSAGQPGAGSVTRAQARRIADRAGRHTVILRAESDAKDPASVRLARHAFFVLRDEAALTGRDLVHERAGVDETIGRPVVLFDFTVAGRARFQAVTRRIAHRGRRAVAPGMPPAAVANHFAVTLDDQLISVPYIDPELTPDGIDGANGSQISGAFDRAAAEDLAALLAAGPLPAKLDLVEERSR